MGLPKGGRRYKTFVVATSMKAGAGLKKRGGVMRCKPFVEALSHFSGGVALREADERHLRACTC
eukprot:1784664-Rhodomonas_salina.1